MRARGYSLSESSFKNDLQKMLEKGEIARAGRNAYFVMPQQLRRYHFNHSSKTKEIARLLTRQHPYLDFTILELTQLNEFVNHQIANNTLFISVPKDVGVDVMNTLQQAEQWVLLQPSQKMLRQYWKEGMVVINRLITEAPMMDEPRWSPCLEKVLVDILADKSIHDAVASSEFARIYETAFERYVIDESALFRYARRRNAYEKMLQLIFKETEVELRTIGL